MTHNDFKENISPTDPFVQKFFARIPPDTAATFTNTQLTELKKVFQVRAQSQHSVDIRLSLPAWKRRFYLVFLLGKETRHSQRLQARVGKPANQILMRLSGVIIIASLIGTLYMVEQRWGINKVSEQLITKSLRVFGNND